MFMLQQERLGWAAVTIRAGLLADELRRLLRGCQILLEPSKRPVTDGPFAAALHSLDVPILANLDFLLLFLLQLILRFGRKAQDQTGHSGG